MRLEAEAVLSIELVPCEGFALPPFSAGAHIDLVLPNGLTRSYSLINGEHECNRYVIGILDAAGGSGGSRWLHENVRIGTQLRIRPPKNRFALSEEGDSHILIAGGIGITPFLSMLARLNVLQRRWTLHYCVRSPARAAFTDSLISLSAAGFGTVINHVSELHDSPRFDMDAVVSAAPVQTHLYCCGPPRMLEAFQLATASRNPEQVHREHFGSTDTPVNNRAFTIVLARSRARIAVPCGQTVLEALLQAGVQVPHSCLEGICGSCETRVLNGVPEHRDLVLSPQERRANRTMMVCVSGCLSDELLLDL